MPFIEQGRRKIINGSQGLDGLDEIKPGDRCYVFYKEMVDEWKAAPRWTTAHNIYKAMMYDGNDSCADSFIAHQLAWQVFFVWYVIPYELKKCKENGDI